MNTTRQATKGLAIEDLISPPYLPLTRESGARFRPQNNEIVVVLRNFLVEKGIDAFREDARKLLEDYGTRRDLTLGGTPRRFTTVNGKHVQRGNEIPALMLSEDLRMFISGIAGIELEPYADVNESLVLLEAREGGCHGTHVDEFPAVFNIAIETPQSADAGGVLRFIPGNEDFGALKEQPCEELCLNPGDAYFMKFTNGTAHEVTPLTKDSRRLIASLALSIAGLPHRPSRSSAHLFKDE